MPSLVSSPILGNAIPYLKTLAASLKDNSRSMFVFDAAVDWHERHEFLKCSFFFASFSPRSLPNRLPVELPLNIHNDNATYETQFGHVQRPTHKNTTWDMAKFEVCGHKV